MICKLCDPERNIPIDKTTIAEHMIITKSTDGSYHVHGPLNNKKEIQDMIQILCRETDLALFTKTKTPPIQATINVKNDEQIRLESQYSTVESRGYSNRLTMK